MSKKKYGRNRRKQQNNLPGILVLILILVVALLAVALLTGLLKGLVGDDSDTTGHSGVLVEKLEDLQIESTDGLKITKVGSYTGIFVEDGSNDAVSQILMVVVENVGNRTIQYAQVQLTDGSNTAQFTLSTLPPGESAVLLEKNRMEYADGQNMTDATIQNVVLFPEEPSVCEDRLEIQGLDGALNVSNISGKDIDGDVVIYYKNASPDMLYGGITYRVTIAGGIKAGEIRQIVAGHFTENGSRIMWVTVE